jgi:hypothetical protein
VSPLDDIIVGDLVKLTKGDEIVQGRVKRDSRGLLFVQHVYTADATDLEGRGPRIEAYVTRYGWTLEVVERGKPPLPTAPGLYESEKFPLSQDYAAYLLTTRGSWFEVMRGGLLIDADIAAKAGHLGALTPLVPKPAAPTVVVDKDDDKWTLAVDGTWVMDDDAASLADGNGETLDYVRRQYGPLKTLEGAPA